MNNSTENKNLDQLEKDLYLFNRKSYSRGIAFGLKLVGKG